MQAADILFKKGRSTMLIDLSTWKAKYSLSPREGFRPSRGQRRSLLLAGLVLILVAILLTACTSAESKESIATVQAAYDRLNAGDADGFLEYFTDDAVMMSDSGEPGFPLMARYYIHDFVKQGYQVKLSDITADGNVVKFVYDLYLRDTSKATFSDYVDVVVDGKIIYDGRDMFRTVYCEQRLNEKAFCK
jgi:ketosteroid isomerase-like protein